MVAVHRDHACPGNQVFNLDPSRCWLMVVLMLIVVQGARYCPGLWRMGRYEDADVELSFDVAFRRDRSHSHSTHSMS